MDNKTHMEYRAECFKKTGHPGGFFYPIKVTKNNNEGKDIVSFDVDHLEIFGSCSHRHMPAFCVDTGLINENGCKCHLPVISIGQDESIYSGKAQPRKGWIYNNKMRLRSKSDGVGVMVSAFTSSYSGIGCHISPEQLAALNKYREANNLKVIVGQPGLKLFDHGQNRDGYWNSEMFNEQVVELIAVMEWLHPGMQIITEIDHSGGHMKQCADALCATGKRKF